MSKDLNDRVDISSSVLEVGDEDEIEVIIEEEKSNGFTKDAMSAEAAPAETPLSPESPSPLHGIRDMDQEEELRHYHKVASTFKSYKKFGIARIEKTLKYVKSMSKEHQVLLKDYKKHVLNILRCIDINHNLFQLMILDSSCMFENHDEVYPKTMKTPYPEPTMFDYDKLQAVLKHIVRDWTADGKKERDLCYRPLIDEVEDLFGTTKVNGYSDVKILVPGAGMGRLSHELVKRGYIVQGNEFSLFMIFASNFILNKCQGVNVYKCHPWIHQNNNVLNHEDQTREVSFPDVDPCDLPENTSARFSMTAGDFLEAYATPNQNRSWDCLVTCFFIDCANNIISYLERIFYCLKEGGVWINLGPLLYHYSDLPDENSIEPPFDLLLEIIKRIGFQVMKINTSVPTMYAENEKSMLSYTYRSIFLVCLKPVKTESPVLAT